MAEQKADVAGRVHVGDMRRRDGRFALVALIFAALAGIIGISWAGLERVLPMVSALLVSAGFAIAAIAWLSGAPRKSQDITSWDLAGALTFVGFASAIVAN